MFAVKHVTIYYGVLVVWALFTVSKSSGIDVCPSDTDGQISWPNSNSSNCVKSKPFCISENMEILSRCCDSEGNWDDAPTCSCYQDTISNPCPDNLDWKSNVCIFVIENSDYPPQCPYEENLPFREYVSIVNSQLLPIWMPVKRDTCDYGIDVLRWMELTSAYKTPYTLCNSDEECNDYYYYDGSISDKNCLIYYNSSFVEAVSCDEKHTAICAYQNLPERMKSFCSQTFPNLCVQSNYSSKSKCFCQGQMKGYSSAPRVEFIESYQNLLYSSLSGMCYIGLQNANSTYVWKNSNVAIKYSNWAAETAFEESYKYGAMTPNGWIMTKTENETDCVLYEVEVPLKNSEIILSYAEQKFTLKLTNPSSWVFEQNGSIPMVFCFTDAASNALVSSIYPTGSMVTEAEAEFYFYEHNDGPGTYWCEAFLYPDVVAKSSNKYLLRHNNSHIEEYVVILKQIYSNQSYANEGHPVTQTNIDGYQKQLAGQILSQESISHFQVRIYKIVEVDGINAEITINFHVVNPNQSEPLAQYIDLRTVMELNVHNFTFVKILGVDHCVGVQTSQITWPVTPINTAAKPREGYCVRKDGSIMNRYCLGNYIDGADWLNLDEDCTIELSTNTTVNLTNIVSLNNAQENIDKVVEISKNSLELVAQDIDLISHFLDQVAQSDDINLNSFMQIINQIMEVPEQILKESQASFNATDRILYQIQNVINQSNYIGELVDGNFFIISYYINDCNLSAIAIQKYNGTYYNINKLCNVSDINEILEINNLEVAFILSDGIMTRLLQEELLNSRVIVTIYTNSRLFSEINVMTGDTDLIIGVSFPHIAEKLIGKITTVYTLSESKIDDISCSFWNYDLGTKQGYWAEAERIHSNTSIICTYDHPTHFTLVRNKDVNITYELQTLIDSDLAISNKLDKTFELLKNYYMNFQPIDLVLISQLLHLAAESNEDSLELVADIINVIIDIPQEVLESSQLMYNATGRILIYFDQILQNSHSSMIVRRDNVYAVVQFLEDTSLYGFTLDHCDQECNFALLSEKITIEEVSLIEKLDTALLINNDLLDQLIGYNKEGYVPKIVITLFFKKSLFIEDYTPSKIATKIVAVSFPEFNESLQGALVLLYNLDSNIALNITTCSVYQNDNDESTIEKGFWNSESPSDQVNGIQKCEFWQPKYFALMYSLVNLTSSLEALLTSTEDMVTVLTRTNDIIKDFPEYLEPVDLDIIARLLSKVGETSEDILEMCVNIISNIMNISGTVLRASQEKYNATNAILYIFNNIAQTYNETKETYRNNVVLIISLISQTEIYGITLENCSEHCNVTILYNKNAIFQDSELKKFDVELKLSSDLIENLLEAKSEYYSPILVLTVFFTDVLFVEKNDPKNSRYVFGIHFPNYNRTLSNEISIALQLPTRATLDHYNCVSWSFRDENVDGIEGSWLYESQTRDNKTLVCNFYEQNYFTLVEGNSSIDNATQVLEYILNSNMSFLAKLYKTEDLSFYYLKLQPLDIYLFSLVLLQCDKLSNNGLDMVNTIVNNLLRVSEEVLLASGDKYDALREILRGINHISNFEETREYSLLNDQFGLVVCELMANSSIGVILTSGDIKCTYDAEDTAFVIAENIAASINVSKEVVAQALQESRNPKIIVSVFSNNIFFNIEETQNSTEILGLSVPSIQDTLEGEIVVLFNNSIYDNSKYSCGYWKNLSQWKVSDEEHIDSFKKCKYSEATYFTLLENIDRNGTINITDMLNNIIDANCTPSEKLHRTLNLLSLYSEQFEPIHVYLVSKILSFVEEVDLSCLGAAANITSSLMSLPREVLVYSQDEYDATDWILYHIDRIAEKIEDSVQIETENFAVVISNNISGILVEQCDTSCNIQTIFDDVNITSLKEKFNFNIAALILDDSVKEEIRNNSSSIIVITVYFNDALFNEGYGITYKNIGPIIGIVIPDEDIILNGSLKFYYYTETNNGKVCAFWNYTLEEEAIVKGHWKKGKVPLQPTQMLVCESKYSTHFALLRIEVNVTSDLEDILNSNSTATEKLKKVMQILTDSVGELGAVDIYLISKILEHAVDQVDVSKLNLTSHIISSLFYVPRSVLRESQVAYYATDTILQAVEGMGKGLNSIDVEPIITNNFTVVAYDLKETDISGLLLENCNNTQCNISVLEGSVNITELVTNKNLQTAVVLSDELLNQVRQSEGSPKLVVTIYFSDVLFNEESEREGKVSMVCGVLLPEFNETFLGNLYVMFSNADNSDYNSSCAFWNFQVQNGENVVNSSWRSEVDPRNKEHFTICEYDHITHFALLLARDNSSFADANKYKILDIITAINCILSIIGIFGILLTAALFERWRRNTGNQILVHFSIAISIKIVMLYVSFGVYADKSDEVVCSVTGAILHYAILSEFCWMLIIAILQFKRFVEVLGGPPKFVLLKACICGWIFPLLPVALIFLMDKKNYNEGQIGLCYPSGLGLYLGIWLPLIIIICINFVIYIFIIYNVFHKKTESRDLVNHEILFQWRLALLLFSMLGLTWLFGFLSQIPGLETVFVCLFCFSATLQGFVMFLFFIVFNKSTRFLYSQSIKLWLYSRGYKIH